MTSKERPGCEATVPLLFHQLPLLVGVGHEDIGSGVCD